MGEGGLVKLKIEAYKDAKFSSADGATFSAMFNPDQYSVKYEIESDDTSGSGTSGSTQKFKKIKPQDLTLNFTIDGTGATGEKVDVSAKVRSFLSVTHEYKGDEHRPRYLKIVWGELLFKCVFKTADITYSLFSPDGKPLRAKIAATFSGAIEDKLRAAQEDSSSPDLTHVRRVTEGETLPLMCFRIYGDSKYYLQVAKANRLDYYRKLKAGQQIYFPPLAND